jgi:hypothetical protein
MYRLRLISVNSTYVCLFWDSSSFLEGEVIDVYRATLGSFFVTIRLILNWVQNWFENSRLWFKIRVVAALRVGGCCLAGKTSAVYGRAVLHTGMQVGSIGVGAVRSHTRAGARQVLRLFMPCTACHNEVAVSGRWCHIVAAR